MSVPSTSTTYGLTIASAIAALYPQGYEDHAAFTARLRDKRKPRRDDKIANPPCRAVDLFAIAGFLLVRSGAYHHVSPEVAAAPTVDTIAVTQADREAWIDIGRAWRGDGSLDVPPPPDALVALWNELLADRDRAVFRTPGPGKRPLRWWRAALALLCIADEAAKDMGFDFGRPKSAQATLIEFVMRERIRRGHKVYTIAGADKDHVCVLPKSRTPKVGCTMRSLSHNLALLPPRGLARAYWTPADAAPDPLNPPFNLVVVPAPFRIRSKAFKGVPSSDAKWGWFQVEPHWCPPSTDEWNDREFDLFYRFVDDLLRAAEADVGEVHGLVFPEVALSHDVFTALCNRLQGRRHFELLISGLFDARVGIEVPPRRGNFAAMAKFQTQSDEPGYSTSIREKHHRWRIEADQIETYALGGALDANFGWWEHIDILSRSLDMFVIRGASTVTTLICEDLARNDPCQELVRGIGPNLVVALLMDGPQQANRWPARYATVLAEDPGCSVLTFTSLGLMERTNGTGRYTASRKIGLWRDDSGKTFELELPARANALCLSLQPSQRSERTLDGRINSDAQSWRLTGVAPLSIDANEDIMKGDWPTLSDS
jgi:hypothetical protein